VILRRLNFICRRFGTVVSIFVGGVNRKNNKEDYTAYDVGTERSEISAHKIQKPENHPIKEYRKECGRK
jgi:hypothetical protein